MIDKKSRNRIFPHFRDIFELFRANENQQWIYDSIKREHDDDIRLGNVTTRESENLACQQRRQEINSGRWNMHSISFVRQQSILHTV